nr:hypothetical protein [Tanacetum cinerariifolium]
MTGYSLWEVILNGDSPISTKVVDGVVQPVAPTTAEQRLAKKNELKARGTLLMALPYKHHLPSEWRTHTLIWRNKENLEDQCLDDLFNNLKIYEAEVKSSSSTSHNTPNIAFVSFQNTDSTNESVRAVPSVTTASTKASASIIPNVDNMREIDLKWQMAMLTMRAMRFLQRTERKIGANGTTSIGFNMSKVECYNCHRRGHFARECSYDWSFQADEEPQIMPSWHLPPQAHQVLIMRKKFEKAEQEKHELKLKLENFQTSLKNLSKLLESQITDKTRLGYDNQVFNSTVFDCDELISSDSDESVPTSPVHDRYKSVPLSLARKCVNQIGLLSLSLKIRFLTQKMNLKGNPQQALKDKGVIDSGCSRHMTGNISYLSYFEEINGGYVAFGRNTNGGKITGKDPLGKFDGNADEGFLVGYSVSSMAFRVFNSRTIIVQETLQINFLENQPNVAGNGPSWMFDIDTLTQKELVSTQQYVLLPLWSTDSKDPQNTDVDATFDDKENDSKIYVSLSSGDKTKKHDEKEKGEAKGKSHVDFSTCVRDLSDEFEEFFVNSTNRVNAANDKEDVGAEADFSNLETSITVSPIPTTTVHKDHPATQIIGDLSSAPQTRSITMVVKDQVKQKDNEIFINQDKYVAKILRKFGLNDGKSASAPIDTEKPLLKDPDGEDVDVHIYSNEALAIPGQMTTGKESSNPFMADSLPDQVDENDEIEVTAVDLKLLLLGIFLRLMQDTNEAEPAKVEEVIEIVTAAKLMTKVVTTAATTIIVAQVPKASAPRRTRGVVIQDPKETATASVIGHKEEGNKRKGESLNQDAAKKQRIDEEIEELKIHLQIIANDDDDVYTEATPLALKVPVVDYQIHHEYNKPYYKIVRADGTRQLFLCFITLLKNFEREDLEMIWKLIQERFQSS